ncbi:hypothetical protein [Pseudarthrobacter sp. LT1]|uniref:hypothetical protein n=1 Tax=Pseudarthrobacter sp. LT1 TaxID=3111450 RepID=UPI002D7704A4|nr:hypothetical protein [Pseudarthrobacter sp. LT1]WRT14686.1 hypothetical protein VIK36_04105 [Pseudarthrobacter sp. LT1]
MTILTTFRKPKRWLAAAAITTALVGGLAAAPAEAAGRTVYVSFSNSNCNGGGSVTAVQFGAVPGISSVPKANGSGANIKLLSGSRNVQFAANIYCTKGWGWFKRTTQAYVIKNVWVPANATRISL